MKISRQQIQAYVSVQFSGGTSEFAELGRLDKAHRTANPGVHSSPLLGRASDIAVAIRPLKRVRPALRSRYLVKGWLDRGAFSVIYGESNVGKTFFAMDLGLHVAAGANWHGHRVPTGDKFAGPVLYVAAEGGSGINNRIEAMRRQYPDLMNQIEEAGDFSLLAAPLDLCTSNDADYLIEAIRSGFPIMPSLIVVDTLARTMGNGDENMAKDMGLFVRNIDMLREVTNAHVMVIHHSGKDASKGARGSGSLRAAADTEIELTRSDDVVVAEARKQRDMPCEGVFAYRLKSVFLGTDDDGDKVTSAVVEQADIQKTDKRERVSGRVQVALNALHDALRDKGRVIRSSELPNVPVVELAEWQAYCDRVGLTDSDNADTKARTFRRHRDALMDKNRIRIFDNYVWVTDKADKARTNSDLSATDPDGHGHPPIRVSVCPSAQSAYGDDADAFHDPNSSYWQRTDQ
ncbi:MAG: helicase RepA family protein [Paracoccus sp. (in: a-proteobacteria)]|jgi:hypothetical protein|uniref:AAA family ATPase n=1 Tax=Paracoccus sp. TaxID=267 RepID=UPI0032D8B88C